MQIDADTSERLDEQRDLLPRIYQAELAQDAASLATESARSNMIAVNQSIDQIYGKGDALRGLVFQANPERKTTP